MSLADTFVSVVAPMGNEAKDLGPFVQEVLATLRTQFANFELVLVDYASVGAVVGVATRLVQEHASVRLLRLARCFSADIACIAGLETAIGDFVAVLRPDEDPPGEIPHLVELASRGADVVQGVAVGPPREGLLFRVCQAVFYFACNRLLRLELPPPNSSLCGFSRRAVNAILRIKQKQPDLALLSCGVGFPRQTFPYRKVFRTCAPEHRALLQALDRGIGLLATHSRSPLRFISYLGSLASLLNFLYVIYVVVVNCVKRNVAEGWTTLSLQNSLMFLFVFLILVLMAEYVSRILEESRDRPLYHVLEELGSATVAADAAQRNVLDSSKTEPEAERERIRAA